jgi:hypothetical protein
MIEDQLSGNRSIKSRKSVGIFVSLGILAAILYVTVISEDNKQPLVVGRDFAPTTSTNDSSGVNKLEESDVVNQKPATQIPVNAGTSDTEPAVAKSVYVDGVYSAVGTYMSPGGQDQISVSVALTNDTITRAEVLTVTADKTSQKYINKFIDGYKVYVVGKSIKDLNLSKVSGSSLTPIGFNNAITQIKSKAKA